MAHKMYQMAHKMYQMAFIYSKWPKNIPIFSIPRPSKIYLKWDFWYENIPPGNTGSASERVAHDLQVQNLRNSES
jgi:hypothetical protein